VAGVGAFLRIADGIDCLLDVGGLLVVIAQVELYLLRKSFLGCADVV
jgi:hypothetical protein